MGACRFIATELVKQVFLAYVSLLSRNQPVAITELAPIQAPVRCASQSLTHGRWLTAQLLEKGWNVRGTVRSLKNEDKVAHLRLLAEALPGKLTLHEAGGASVDMLGITPCALYIASHNHAVPLTLRDVPFVTEKCCLLADLLQECSFDEVVKGAEYVFHTASPFFTK